MVFFLLDFLVSRPSQFHRLNVRLDETRFVSSMTSLRSFICTHLPSVSIGFDCDSARGRNRHERFDIDTTF